jgi:hypothetical protein
MKACDSVSSIGALLVAGCLWLSPLAIAAEPIDIASSGILLQRGWYPLEASAGRSFRWVDNDATFTIEAPTARLVFVTLAAEGGPGLGTTSFPVRVLDAGGRQVDAVLVTAQQRDNVLILPVNAGGSTFKLHVDGGGKRVGADPRILDFRVFALTFPGTHAAQVSTVHAAQRAGADITEGGVRIGNGWYPLEHFAGNTFRWVDNDAQLIVDAPKPQRAQLRLSVATGPGMAQRPFTLFLRDRGGRALGSARVNDLSNVTFPVELRLGPNAFVLHGDGGGKPAVNDPRTLNFRVLHVALVT